MNDPSLVLRAEQALIGAALVDRGRLLDVPYLKPSAFAHPTNRAIYAALLEQSSLGPEVANVLTAVAERVNLPSVTSDYLGTLAEASRGVASITVYGRLVEEAAVRRDLAAYADAVTAEAAARPDHQLDRLARALRQQTRTAAVAELAEPAPALYVPADVPLSTPGTRAHQEELLLACLMTYPSQVAQVEWLTTEAFEPSPRREIYAAIIAVTERGEPVEELTVIWEIERQRPDLSAQDTYATSHADYLSRLAKTAVAVGLAVEIGSELLADELITTLSAEAASLTHGGSEQRITGPSPTPANHRIDQPTPSPTQPPPRPAAPAPKPDIRP
ncbi:DnaB-like helicase N-terminal domain-containing protein [Streptomyces sp. NPDC008317]|uniref:DnaB-like helicase N-terminal domain-containing protein n=1 Tax=Streptomyces sp. NPDC008317 TaxID=3364827 RepID=UPI0036E31CC6